MNNPDQVSKISVLVVREACCGQDDQLGPLEKRHELPRECPLGEFISIVNASRFLQYSSTHVAMTCRIGNEAVATVFNPHQTPARMPLFMLDPGTPIRDLLEGARVHFTFRQS